MQYSKYYLFCISACLVFSASIVNAENNANISTNKVVVQQNKQTEIKGNENRNNNNIDSIKNNKTHIVQNGENVYRISLKYNIKQDELTKLNNIKNNFIKVGQKLVLPDNAILDTTLSKEKETTNSQQQDNYKNEKKEVKTTHTNATKSKDILTNLKATQTTVNEKDRQNEQSKQQETQTIHQSTFIWPVHGVIVSKFGSVGKNNVMLEGLLYCIRTYRFYGECWRQGH